MGAFDDLKWTYDGAFKHLFDLGLNGELILRPSQFNALFPIARPTHFFGKVKKKKFQNHL